MNYRVGIEKTPGIGGGIVSKESQRNLEKAEDLCRRGKPEQCVPYLTKALEDLNNLDAVIQMAFLTTKEGAMETLERGEHLGCIQLTKRFGKDCFEDSGSQVGRFWDILETRPYMRVLQALFRIYFENGEYEKSTGAGLRMLRLCPGDNLSQRTWLGSNLIRTGLVGEALYFAQSWLRSSEKSGTPPVRGGTKLEMPSFDLLTPKQEESYSQYGNGALLYTAALACFKVLGDIPQARQYLRVAAKANPHVLLKILGKIPRPSSYTHFWLVRLFGVSLLGPDCYAERKTRAK